MCIKECIKAGEESGEKDDALLKSALHIADCC